MDQTNRDKSALARTRTHLCAVAHVRIYILGFTPLQTHTQTRYKATFIDVTRTRVHPPAQVHARPHTHTLFSAIWRVRILSKASLEWMNGRSLNATQKKFCLLKGKSSPLRILSNAHVCFFFLSKKHVSAEILFFSLSPSALWRCEGRGGTGGG